MLHVNKVYQGNALEILRQLPSKSVNCGITSPPYWSKRNYGTNPSIWGGEIECDHQWEEFVFQKQRGKSKKKTAWKRPSRKENAGSVEQYSKICTKCGAWRGELGLEPFIDMYVSNLCDIFDELKRVLKDDGTFYLNIGDTYYGTGSGQKCLGKQAYLPRDVVSAQTSVVKGTSNKELPRKCLSMIPQRVALEMVNRGWILRNVLIWHKPNAMPESVKDRFTTDFEYIYFFSKKTKYYFEQQLEPYTEPLNRWGGEKFNEDEVSKFKDDDGDYIISNYDRRGKKVRPNPDGRNKRSIWSINTKHFKGAHFATFPEELVKTPILASCPEFVCISCRKPRKKIFKKPDMSKRPKRNDDARYHDTDAMPRTGRGKSAGQAYQDWRIENPDTFIGYSDCGCNDEFKSGIVIDPFAGAGTTLKVAHDLGRSFVGIELNPDYIDIISKRLGFDVSIKRDWEV